MEWLLDTAHFFTRNHCGVGWTSTLILISRFVNFLIFFAYFSIPVSLMVIWWELRGIASLKTLKDTVIQSRWIVLMFVFFIFFCGLTHLCDVLVFDWAPYRLFTLVDTITAVLSVTTAVFLPRVSRHIIDAIRKRNS
jgi:hypothetical protein